MELTKENLLNFIEKEISYYEKNGDYEESEALKDLRENIKLTFI